MPMHILLHSQYSQRRELDVAALNRARERQKEAGGVLEAGVWHTLVPGVLLCSHRHSFQITTGRSIFETSV